jgi:hypothetical protein
MQPMKINMQKWAEDIIAARDVKNLRFCFFRALHAPEEQ